MTPLEHDMEALVDRLKQQAAQADLQDSLAIESWLALWQKRLASVFHTERHRLYDPGMPRLAELLSAHLDDETFVERAYTFLMGRPSDAQGAAYYQQLTVCEGRLTMLVTLLQSHEAKQYVQKQQMRLPRGLCQLVCWHQRLTAVPGVRRLGEWGWQVVTQALWRHRLQCWKEDGEYYDILAHHGQRQMEHRALATTLTEMADIQKALVMRVNAGQKAALSTENGPAKWLSNEHAIEMVEVLQRAQQALSASEEGGA